ncbi:MAG TPA: cytochrome c oxidase subunit I [Actinomycetes bacterium]|nr:cytochrome c oxidase subunit I [Actinomycetes bacterium]
MTTVAERTERLRATWGEAPGLATWFKTVDHKKIGRRYIWTAFAFFTMAGFEALAMRTQLARPDETLIGPGAYNQLFTMHGTTMIFLFATPMLFGFGNYFVPLMLGARDMAFPRLNAFGYWVFLFAGLLMNASFLFGVAPNGGWFNYVPLTGPQYTPQVNIGFYTVGLLFLGISTTAGAINFIVTTFKLRAPGMSLNRIPLFVWAILATAFAVVFALPALNADNAMLLLDRRFGFHFFDPAKGGDPVLWQHLFWLFGHPDVYIIVLPALGIVSAIVPVFSRRPMVGYFWLVLANVATAVISFGVWVHHMFAVGLPQLSMSFFSAASLVITIPGGIQIFSWVITMLRGRLVLATPMLFVIGFLISFVAGGLTGVMFAVVPFDQQVTDSYFVVAHFHYVLFGGAVFPILAAVYYWMPKITGRLLDERLGKVSFWLIFVGFNLLFFPMHLSGLLGMPRRVYTYSPGLGWDAWNLASTAGAYVVAVGILATVVNFLRSLRRGEPAGDDPWGGDSLEWATSSPPPPYNFAAIPEVHSAYPLWEERFRERLEAARYSQERQLAGDHEVLRTSELDAEPERAVEMPEVTIVPLVTAVGFLLVFGGLLAGGYVVAAAGVPVVLGGLAAWAWPRREELAT